MPTTAAPVPDVSTLASAGGRSRLDSVDLLRGLVMVVMALDHVRDFVSWCMIGMAGIVFLPRRAIAVFGIATIVLHDLLDGIHAQSLGGAAPLWRFLHEMGMNNLPGDVHLFIVYPLVPWIGVMAAGYAFGELLVVSPARRRRRLAILGGALTLAFVVLRLANVYGDPHPWQPQPTAARTILAILACEKYPPSLAYLLMTLGPSILSLAAFDGVKSALARPFIDFGRVPLFFYLLHLPLIHGMAIFVARIVYGRFVPELMGGPFGGDFPESYGYGLGGVYALWAVVVLLLYPVCRWFAGVKQRRRDVWLSYL